VVSGAADIGLANIGSSFVRNQFVEYPAVAMSYGGAGILVRHSPASHKYLEVYFQPFTLPVWLNVLAVIPVSALFLCVTSRYRYRPLVTRTTPLADGSTNESEKAGVGMESVKGSAAQSVGQPIGQSSVS